MSSPEAGTVQVRRLGVAYIPAALSATVLWSAGNLLASSASLDGPQLAFWRTVCGATLYQIVWRARGGRMRWATIRTAAVGGLGFGLQATFYFSALQLTSVTTAAVIGALQPILMIPISWRALGERVGGRQLLLVVCAVSGAALVVVGSSSTGDDNLVGDVLAVIGTVVGCFYFTGTKTARVTLSTVEYQAAALTVAAMATLPGALMFGNGLTVPTVGQAAWPVLMTIVPGSGHLLMSWAQRHLSVGTTSTIALLVTPISALGSVLVLGETLAPPQFFGIAIVVVALGLFVRGIVDVASPAAAIE